MHTTLIIINQLVAKVINYSLRGVARTGKMSSIRVSSGTPSSGTGKLRPVHIRANPPPPGQWTLVRECNIEKRDRFTVSTSSNKPARLSLELSYLQDWQQTLVAHLRQMQDQLVSKINACIFYWSWHGLLMNASINFINRCLILTLYKCSMKKLKKLRNNG